MLACVLVVLAHVNIYARSGLETWWPDGVLFGPVLALAVPVFFMIAGVTADLSAAARGDSRAPLLSSLKRLFVPFLAWNAITLAALAVTGPRPAQPVWQLLTGTWHLYFLFALMQILIIYHALRPMMDSPRFNLFVGAAVGVTIIAFAVSEAMVWVGRVDGGNFEAEAKKVFVFWIAFFAVGVWWRRNGLAPIGRRATVITGLLGVAAFWMYAADLQLQIDRFGFTPRKQLVFAGLPFQLIGAFGLLSLLNFMERRSSYQKSVEALAAQGKDTYGIYLSHIAVLVVVYRLWQSLGGPAGHWAEVPVLTTATWLVSRSLVRVVRAIGGQWTRLVILGERTTSSAVRDSLAA